MLTDAELARTRPIIVDAHESRAAVRADVLEALLAPLVDAEILKLEFALSRTNERAALLFDLHTLGYECKPTDSLCALRAAFWERSAMRETKVWLIAMFARLLRLF